MYELDHDVNSLNLQGLMTFYWNLLTLIMPWGGDSSRWYVTIPQINGKVEWHHEVLSVGSDSCRIVCVGVPAQTVVLQQRGLTARNSHKSHVKEPRTGPSQVFQNTSCNHCSDIFWTMCSVASWASMTPILCHVLSGWSCFHYHACIESNIKWVTLD